MRKSIFTAVLAIFALVSPVFAEQVPSADPLAQCYESTKNITTNMDTAIQECLMTKLETSIELLNSAFGQTKSALEGIDSVNAVHSVKALIKSQDVFRQFRDAECERESLALIGGSDAKNALLSCQVQLNNWRTNQLFK